MTNLKLEDLALRDTHFEPFIESSKTDQYRGGSIVPIVKSGTDLCLWGNFETYLYRKPNSLYRHLPKVETTICSGIFKPSLDLVLSPSAQAPNCLIQDVEKSYQRRLQT